MPTIMPLLYQSGYITIKEYHEDYNYYVLDVPNKEVNRQKAEFRKYLENLAAQRRCGLC